MYNYRYIYIYMLFWIEWLPVGWRYYRRQLLLTNGQIDTVVGTFGFVFARFLAILDIATHLINVFELNI